MRVSGSLLCSPALLLHCWSLALLRGRLWLDEGTKCVGSALAHADPLS